MQNFRVWILLLLGLVVTGSAQPSGNDQKLVDEMIRFGFENARVNPDGNNSLTIYYENRLFRHELVALATVEITTGLNMP